ncbi:hypothetical protein ACWIYZ_08590 [Ursidibacter arcticus]
MANITLSFITPKYFYETVRLLKMQEHRIYITVDSLEIRFNQKRFESKEDVNNRMEQLEHFMLFLQELVHSDVPVDLDEFVKRYRKSPGSRYFPKR